MRWAFQHDRETCLSKSTQARRVWPEVVPSPNSFPSVMHSPVHTQSTCIHTHVHTCNQTYTLPHVHSHQHKVKKGLDKLYHKMEKDMSDASQLEVTWGIMQKAFIEQFKEFEDLIEKCYPGSSITLVFTIEDLTNYISQAKSTQQ